VSAELTYPNAFGHQIFAGGEFVQLQGVRKLLDFRGGFTGVQRKAIEAITV